MAKVERAVLRFVAAGKLREAAEEVIRRIGPEVLRYLRAVMRDEDDASDGFSDWAESVWNGLPAFRGDAALRTWAFTLAVHVAGKMRTSAWRRRVRRLGTGEASRIAEEIRTRTKIRAERQRIELERLREALSPADQTLLTLRVDQGLSWEEIAGVLSGTGQRATATAMAKRFERLKDRLARLARESGLLDGS
jgi:RNA polymerase sigma-70 factor, ECF subfamily